jgi:hypothetical protein
MVDVSIELFPANGQKLRANSPLQRASSMFGIGHRCPHINGVMFLNAGIWLIGDVGPVFAIHYQNHLKSI